MQGAFIVAIIFGGIVLSLAVIGASLLMTVKILKGGVSRRQQQSEAQEARMIQEIYQGLSKLEARLEALETIVIDPKKGSAGDETN